MMMRRIALSFFALMLACAHAPPPGPEPKPAWFDPGDGLFTLHGKRVFRAVGRSNHNERDALEFMLDDYLVTLLQTYLTTREAPIAPTAGETFGAMHDATWPLYRQEAIWRDSGERYVLAQIDLADVIAKLRESPTIPTAIADLANNVFDKLQTKANVFPAAGSARKSSHIVCDATKLFTVFPPKPSDTRLDIYLQHPIQVPPSDQHAPFPHLDMQERLGLLATGVCGVTMRQAITQPRIVRPRKLTATHLTSRLDTQEDFYLVQGRLAQFTPGITYSLAVDDPSIASIDCTIQMPPHNSAARYEFQRSVAQLTMYDLEQLLAYGGAGIGDDPTVCRVPVDDLSMSVYQAVRTRDLNRDVKNETPPPDPNIYRTYASQVPLTEMQKNGFDCSVLGMKRSIDTDTEMAGAFSPAAKRFVLQYVASMRGALGDLGKLECASLNQDQIYDGTQSVLREIDAREHVTVP